MSCHGGVKRQGGLSLVSRKDALLGGKSGEPTLVPGEPYKSELFRRIVASNPDDRMPARAESLPINEIEVVRRWIEGGAVWPEHWAFVPRAGAAGPPNVPQLHRAHNPIDFFVLSRLEAANITMASEAAPRTLIRRLYLDLLGLLPAAGEVEAYLADRSPDGYERLVDRLLASPHFGERWGRHWLDLARYADTDGYEVDGDRPHAWHWRDWVIDALNSDVPFDQFTIEQLAGDLLPNPTIPQRLATAFHRQTLVNKEGGIDKEEYRVYAVMDRASTTASVWLGLTLGCAQCHDHPYDPITQRAYYEWFAIFNNADEANLRLAHPIDDGYLSRKAAYDHKVAAVQAAHVAARGEEQLALKRQLEELEKKPPKDPAVLLDVLEERKEPRLTYLLRAGNFLHPVREEPMTPRVLERLHPLQLRESTRPVDRLDLARWLMDSSNPLTARVAANRIWSHLFGAGLVRTPDDFGASGEPPTHPELLDWLAGEFIRRGWSQKALIKLIVTSATYRQSSRHRIDCTQSDPENRLLHRQNRFRVDAEVVRDLYLDAGGLLTSKLKGPGVFPPFPQELARIDFRSDMRWVESKGEDRYRRGLYTFFKRTLPDPNLVVFDCPDASATAVQRRHSNTPLQALALLNNEVFVEASQAMSWRIINTVGQNSERLTAAFNIALSRLPTDFERKQLTSLYESSLAWYADHSDDAQLLMGTHASKGNAAEAAAWMITASAILNLDEFISRE